MLVILLPASGSAIRSNINPIQSGGGAGPAFTGDLAGNTLWDSTQDTAISQPCVGAPHGIASGDTCFGTNGETVFQDRVWFDDEIMAEQTTNASAGALDDVATATGTYWNFTAATSISGFADPLDGKMLIVTNNSGGVINVQNNNVGSLAANRIFTGLGTDYSMPDNSSIELIYDTASSMWSVTGASPSVSGSGPGIVVYSTVAAAQAASGSDEDISYVVETETFYQYEATGTNYTADSIFTLITGDGGNTRWLGVGGQYGKWHIADVIISVNVATGDDANDGINAPVETARRAFELASGVGHSWGVTIQFAAGDYPLNKHNPVPFNYEKVGPISIGAQLYVIGATTVVDTITVGAVSGLRVDDSGAPGWAIGEHKGKVLHVGTYYRYIITDNDADSLWLTYAPAAYGGTHPSPVVTNTYDIIELDTNIVGTGDTDKLNSEGNISWYNMHFQDVSLETHSVDIGELWNITFDGGAADGRGWVTRGNSIAYDLYFSNMDRAISVNGIGAQFNNVTCDTISIWCFTAWDHEITTGHAAIAATDTAEVFRIRDHGKVLDYSLVHYLDNVTNLAIIYYSGTYFKRDVFNSAPTSAGAGGDVDYWTRMGSTAANAPNNSQLVLDALPPSSANVADFFINGRNVSAANLTSFGGQYWDEDKNMIINNTADPDPTWFVDGVQSMWLAPNGLGIGTTPTYDLHVQVDQTGATQARAINDNADGRAVSGVASGTVRGFMEASGSAAVGDLLGEARANKFVVYSSSTMTDTFLLGSNGAADLAFATNQVRAITIDQTQQVCIGDTTPAIGLDVNDDFGTRMTTDVGAGALDDISTANTSYVNFTAATSISGFANGADGKRLTIQNTSGAQFNILNNNVGSIAANRIMTGTGGTVALPDDGALELVYDDANSLWMIAGSISAGSGDVSKVGTPVDDQVGVWTGDGTIEGTVNLTYDGSNLQLTGDIGSTGTRITKGWLDALTVDNVTLDGDVMTSSGALGLTATDAALSVTIGTGAADDFIINTSGFVYEGDTGDVGINIADPTATLEVNGEARLTNTGDMGVNPESLVTKSYADALIIAVFWDEVKVATQGDVDLSDGLENGDTIDDYVLVTGDRVGVVAQADASENGLYTVPANGAASRSADADTAIEIENTKFIPLNGTINGEMMFFCTTSSITLGVTAINFSIVTADAATKITGPASSTNNGVVRYNGTTGKLAKDSNNATISDGGYLTTFGASLNGNVIINENGSTVDFRVEGGSDVNALFVEGSTDFVAVGHNDPDYKFHTKSTTPSACFERTSTSTDSLLLGALLKHSTTANMIDGFGVVFNFAIEDSAAVNNYISYFGAMRDGADNSGALVFRPKLAGVTQNAMIIRADGDMGVGNDDPAAKLDVGGGVKIADDADACDATKPGTMKYYVSGNNSYMDMCMQDGAGSYTWTNIVQHNW